MASTYSIKEAISELENIPILYPAIYKKHKNTKITVFSIWGKSIVKLKDLSIVKILKEDLSNFKYYYRYDKDNEGIKDQIIRIETILYDLGELKKFTFGHVFSKKEYPIHIIVKINTLIFSN